MDFLECKTPKDITDWCNDFEVQLKASDDAKAIEDTSSMFNSIKGAAATYGNALGRRIGGTIWVVKNDHGRAIGLMRLKDEGTSFHLLNLVGVPRAGGGAALLQLAKAIALSLNKTLKLEAADKDLIKYYQERCFQPSPSGGMVWTQDV